MIRSDRKVEIEVNVLLDKLIFFLICVSFYLQTESGDLLVVPVIITILVSSTGSLIDNKIYRLSITLLFIGASIYIPSLMFFLPLICLDIFLTGKNIFALFSLIPIIIHVNEFTLIMPLQIILLIFLAGLFFYRARATESWREQSMFLRDEAHEYSLKMQKKQKNLLEKQDYEVNLARLSERNRIAREIHDNLGHQLSRAIIQVGALMTICKHEPEKEQLESIKQTLTDGMNSIRDSIHDLHEKSLSLEIETKKIAEQFQFCPLNLVYDMQTSPGAEYKYAIIAIIKEALSNIMRHSNATEVDLLLREHPGFYQLVIEDNGSNQSEKINFEQSTGIGLRSMQERVMSLNGNIHISSDSGFRIFVTLPKNK